MNIRRHAAHSATRRTAGKHRGALKFVPIGTGKNAAGGWYRVLPHKELEVMSRGQLERVPLGKSDPETKAKRIVRAILKRHH